MQDMFKNAEGYHSTASKLRNHYAHQFQPVNLAGRLAAFDADMEKRNSGKIFGTGQLPDDYNFETEE